MEQNPAPRFSSVPSQAASPVRPTAGSFVDSLFEMPEAGTVKRVSRADGERLEAKLSAEIRALIDARLRGNDAA